MRFRFPIQILSTLTCLLTLGSARRQRPDRRRSVRSRRRAGDSAVHQLTRPRPASHEVPRGHLLRRGLPVAEHPCAERGRPFARRRQPQPVEAGAANRFQPLHHGSALPRIEVAGARQSLAAAVVRCREYDDGVLRSNRAAGAASVVLQAVHQQRLPWRLCDRRSGRHRLSRADAWRECRISVLVPAAAARFYGDYLGDDLGEYKLRFQPQNHELESDAILYAPIRDLFREVNQPEDGVWRDRVEQYVDLRQFVTHVAIETLPRRDRWHPRDLLDEQFLSLSLRRHEPPSADCVGQGQHARVPGLSNLLERRAERGVSPRDGLPGSLRPVSGRCSSGARLPRRRTIGSNARSREPPRWLRHTFAPMCGSRSRTTSSTRRLSLLQQFARERPSFVLKEVQKIRAARR